MPGENDGWWTTSDIAAYLGVKLGTVARYRYPRTVRGRPQPVLPPPARWFGRTPVWKPADITGWQRPGRGAGSARWQRSHTKQGAGPG